MDVEKEKFNVWKRKKVFFSSVEYLNNFYILNGFQMQTHTKDDGMSGTRRGEGLEKWIAAGHGIHILL